MQTWKLPEGGREDVLSGGKDAFKLYDTYGFPLDLTKEILEEKGCRGRGRLPAAMEEQRTKARNARQTTNYMGADATVYDEIDPKITSTFVGYDHPEHNSKISVLTTDTEVTEAISDGEHGTIFVDETPFYATMGGQTGDTGVIRIGEAQSLLSKIRSSSRRQDRPCGNMWLKVCSRSATR